MKINRNSSKKGVASLYVVIFATILFGVIVLSFIRIILSESTQTGNDDLSQSAYDAAMAGVEDAKLAVNRLYKNGDSKTKLFDGDCDSESGTFKLKTYLYNSDAGEVKIQETASGSSNATNGTEQAYTCVILKNVVSDYRSTLTSDTRTKVVPLGIDSAMEPDGITPKLSKLSQIKISWYSEVNGINFTEEYNNQKLKDKTNTSTPPVLSVTLLRTGSEIKLDEFNTSNDPNYGSMLFLPASDKAVTNNLVHGNSFSSDEVNQAGQSSFANEPYLIKCNKGEEFACNVTLNPTMDGIANAMLIISMPYGDTVTDFKVELVDKDGNSMNFENVQISVDSTGRANNLVRRVETRLDPADLFFPYPEYEVELTGNGADTFKKNFWITANCWTESGTCDNNGSV